MQNLPIMNQPSNITEMLPGIEALWNKTKGDPTIKIAVLDGPVDVQHPALKGATIQALDAPAKSKVRSIHGTFVSSLIFANHQSGILGIAPNCSGLVKSIYREDENGYLLSSSQSDIEQGIRIALENGADIINISGGEQLNEDGHIIASLANALEACEKQGVLVIAATGNEGSNRIHVPASYPTVLAVGSINNDGAPSHFSNWTTAFSEVGLVAPGENIVGAVPSTKHPKAILNGTSFSTALVSGVAGLLASLQIQQHQKKDLLAIRRVLLKSVTPCTVDEKIDCAPIMAGRLHIGNAMKNILHSNTTVPSGITQTFSSTVLPVSQNCTATTNPQNFLTLNNTNMENETEVTPSVASNDQPTDAVVPQEASASVEEVAPAVTTPKVPTVAVEPSACGCDSNVTPSAAPTTFNPALNPGGYPTFQNSQLVNAIGQPSYDFGTQNNLDTFRSYMKAWYENLSDERLKDELTDSPHDHKSMAAFLLYKQNNEFPNIFMSSQLIWLLNMNSTPIYSISPSLTAFTDPIYLMMAQFLAENVGIDPEGYSDNTEKGNIAVETLETIFIKEKEDDDLMRMVLPGFVSGDTKLMNGNHVKAVTPVAYGLKNWTLKALLDSMGFSNDKELTTQLKSVLNRLYVTTLNRGESPEDRALNYSLYNILELSEIIKDVTTNKLQLSGYKVVPSKIERQNSISREIQLTFFDPENTNKASTTYAMQVDVSGVTPVLIGETQEWYAPVSVTAVS
jgi:cyanobactin maturation PatA/PatG family protease